MGTYGSIDVKPLAGSMGAEIGGVDLSKPLANEQVADIHQAFHDHLMIYFRNQTLSPKAQVGLSQHFGKPAIYPFLKGLDGFPEVNALIKTEDDTKAFGGTWHSDTSYKERPDLGTLLYAVEVPPAGGDTLFTNAYQAYETLSAGMQEMLSDLIGVFNSDKLYAGGRAAQVTKLGEMGKAVIATEVFEAEHPIVRTHSETGRKALYISRAHTLRFKDMTVEESTPLINYLSDHIVRPEHQCRLRWEPGTLAVWDNRCTQHHALNDYQGQRRHMHRVTIEGDRPV
ncbi:MAG: taurine dioxygenase [Hyphomicrobiaceae bacterium]|jgi:taurine dioxygenase